MEPDLKLTDDLRHGMDWWYALPEADRAAWLIKVHSVRPKDAWEAFKRSLTTSRL
jgi:hypothetical protein